MGIGQTDVDTNAAADAVVTASDTAPVANRLTMQLPDGVSYTQERSQLTLEEMMRREVDPGTGRPTTIRALFDYWQGRREGEVAPPSAFDPKNFFTPEAFRWISWIDVRASDPMDFVFRSHAAFVHGDMSDKPLREYPYEAHARSLALEYLTCKMIQKPSYYEISQKVGTTLRHYTRLLLPVCGPRAPMTRLYYATRYITVERDGERVMPPGEAEAGKD